MRKVMTSLSVAAVLGAGFLASSAVAAPVATGGAKVAAVVAQSGLATGQVAERRGRGADDGAGHVRRGRGRD